jgi:hypothetical protein
MPYERSFHSNGICRAAVEVLVIRPAAGESAGAAPNGFRAKAN